MTDYKQLCAELLDWTRLLIEIPDPPVTRCADDLTDLLARTRAALAEREPEGPTDIELLSMAGTAIGHEIEFGEYEPETECAVEAYGSELIDFARAVLARWGNNTSRSI